MPLPPHDAPPLPSRRALREAERARAAASAVPAARSPRPPAAPPVVPPAAAGPASSPAVPAAAAPAPVAAPGPVASPAPAAAPAPAGEAAPTAPVARPRTRPRVVDLRDHAVAGPEAPLAVPASVRPTRAGSRAAGPRPVLLPGAPHVPAAVAPALTEHVLEGGDDAWVADVVPRPTPVASRAVVPDVPPPTAPTRDRASAWRRLPQLVVVTALVAATVAYATAEDTAATADEVRAYERAEQTVQPEAPSAALAPEEDASGMVAGPDGLLRVQAEASRGGGRSVLPGCDGVPPETPQENGRIDEGYLCVLWDGTTEIRADAAVSLTLLNEQYRARFGQDICLTDGYRSYAAQVSVRNRKPGLAARPGTSEHGFGLAVDLCGGVESQGEGYWWLRENAAAFGWENPRWAQSGGGGPFEPWHWEYVAGQW